LSISLQGISAHALPHKSALAPPLAIKPPCEIVQRTDGSYDVVTNNDVLEAWDKEIVGSYKQGVTV